MKYGEMIGRNNIRTNDAFIYVSNDTWKRQAVKKNYNKSVVTDMQNFLRMENMKVPIYVDEYLPELNGLINQLGAKVVHVPRSDKERSQSVDYLGNRIYDEFKIQSALSERNKKEEKENEKRQHQARMEKLKSYLSKNYPVYVDEQCKYILTTMCGGYNDEAIMKKITEQETNINSFLEKTGLYSLNEKEEKIKKLNSCVEELKSVSYNGIISNCIYNYVFMERYLDDVGHLFLWNKVTADVSSLDMERIKKEMGKKVDPREILLYKLLDFIRSGFTEPQSRAPFVSLKHKTETVEKIQNALGKR